MKSADHTAVVSAAASLKLNIQYIVKIWCNTD